MNIGLLAIRRLPLVLGVFLMVCFCSPQGNANSESQRNSQSPSGPLEGTPTRDEFQQHGSADSRVSEATGGVPLSLQTAVVTALDNNVGFKIERVQPGLSRAGEEIERSAFDPTLEGSLGYDYTHDHSNVEGLHSDLITGDVGLSQYLATGTDVEVGIGGDFLSSDGNSDIRSRGLGWGLSVTQALLRGRGRQVNLVRLRQAELNTEISLFQLRGAAEALLSAVENAYWDTVLAERSVDIYIKSLEVADQQIAEVSQRIQVGTVAETELTAAQAEVASRNEQLIKARGDLAKRRLELIHLLNPDALDGGWSAEIDLLDAPDVPVVELANVEEHLEIAMSKRADLKQARVEIDRGDLEIVRTRNGLLPRLDLFVRLGGSRYADSFTNRSDADGEVVDLSAGVLFEMPLGNRRAKALHRHAVLSRDETELALCNMEQLAQVDVRSAYVEVRRAEEGIKASRATRALREKTLNVEKERARVGKSTSFLVARANRDLVESQISEVEAAVDYQKALLELCRQEGMLLPRWGIDL